MDRTGDENDAARVPRHRQLEGGSECLVGLCLSPAQQALAPLELCPADVWDTGQHANPKQATELAWIGDAGRQLVAPERDQHAHEERTEDREDHVAQRPRRRGAARDIGTAGNLKVGTRTALADGELAQSLSYGRYLRGGRRAGRGLQPVDLLLQPCAGVGDPVTLEVSTLRDEGRGYRVGDASCLYRILIAGGDLDDVGLARVRVDLGLDLVLQGPLGLPRDLLRGPSQNPGGGHQCVGRGQLPLSRLGVGVDAGCEGIEYQLGRGLIGGRKEKRHEQDNDADQHGDREYQP